MLHWGVQCENRKKNTSAQKHIYHKHITLQQGETYPALASSHPVRCHLFRRRSQTRFDSLAVRSGGRQLVGGGSNVCNRGGSKRVPLEVFTEDPRPEDPGPDRGPVRVRVYILNGQPGPGRVPIYYFGSRVCLTLCVIPESIGEHGTCQ